MSRKYKEINKLKQMLRKNDIPFFEEPFEDGLCVTINDYLSCVQYSGSYGANNDLLEIMGGLTEAEYEKDTILGFLTAKEVYRRFRYCYKNKMEFYCPEEDAENNELEIKITTTFSYDKKATKKILDNISKNSDSLDVAINNAISQFLKDLYSSYESSDGKKINHNISYLVKG